MMREEMSATGSMNKMMNPIIPNKEPPLVMRTNKAKTEINNMQYDRSELMSDYAKLKNDYSDMCDEKILVEYELKNTINKQRGLIWFLVIMFVISITANIALYLI